MGEIGKRNGCNYGCCSMRVGKKNFLRCKYDMISFSNQRQVLYKKEFGFKDLGMVLVSCYQEGSGC